MLLRIVYSYSFCYYKDTVKVCVAGFSSEVNTFSSEVNTCIYAVITIVI